MLVAAAAYRTKWRLSCRDLLALAGLGIVNNALYLGLSFSGMRSISSGLAALIISANPVLTAVLAALFLQERMTWRKAVGLALGIAGVALVVQSRIAGGMDSAAGIAFAFGALAALVGGAILFQWLTPKAGLWVGNGVQNLAGGLALMPLALSLESIGAVEPSWRLLIAFAYLALVVSVVGFILWFHLLTTSGATAASSYHFMMPPLGLLFGWLLLGEGVELSDLLGILPVALGIYLVTHPTSPQDRA
jgi:drug/metabolite transporter (DMT)-like permease